jgi:hypothetical protein
MAKRCCPFATAGGACPMHKRPRAAPLVHAAIYMWRLDRVDPEHPLFGTPYIGQVVRHGVDAKTAVETRRRQHLKHAARKRKVIGLQWAILEFGEAAFTVSIVETIRLPRQEAMEWANAREIALIDQYGGMMRDREPSAPIRQTFNLTRGGQGNAAAVWESLEARTKARWQHVQKKLQDYFDTYGNLRVPNYYVCADGTPLGLVVRSMRDGEYITGYDDRVKWLKERAWVAREFDARWDDVQPHIQKYFDTHNHLRVPRFYVAPDGFPLGQLVSNIRASEQYIKGHPERLQWLRERAWVDNEFDARWVDMQKIIDEYLAAHGHLDVPCAYVHHNGARLGQLIARIRTGIFLNGNRERAQWLKDRGFKMHARNPVKNAERWAALGL